ncbi:universal stress protein [Halorubrum lacusprofundi]|jgi:nucleotide-binding universal stress UspA family protein|uniref:UspA domain protein n=1 Tax=Halorubrum lacusprofundi (strain ATCC 49239 / DSM 5036 / JCM 8891 / ACAM 34) TaxID=416348 RepID=B9LTI5_HALLT|nr:universal stress protein [Halorubrum lacusprofundi]ACM58157.1 UspA domain protein [Halorubrum lacusprofundi ATCC 49239]MCG1006240.1 universal stress protein [Halorubrum lacusprofundi]
MYRVLLPVGGDVEHVLSAADAVISLPNATTEVEAEILNVYEGFEASGEGGRVDSEDVWNEENYPDSVGVVEDRLTEAGVSVSKRREHGDPAETIISVAEELDVDNITMSGRRRSPTGKMLFGSTTQSVLLAADRPVTVILDD